MNGLRDRLTGEMHGALRQALQAFRADATEVTAGGADAIAHALATATRASLLAAGIAAESMVRAGGWRFLDLGRRMERAQLGAAVLARLLDQPASRIEGALGLALELGDVLVTYQARYGATVQAAAALDLLIADPDNPRSLAFQFARMSVLLAPLEGGAELAAQADALRAQAEAVALGGTADPSTAAARLAPGLHALTGGACGLSDEVTRQFFTLLPRPRLVGVDVA